MEQRALGDTGRTVGAVGLGCMGMSWGYEESLRRDDESVAVIRAALDLGVSLVDTADVYGAGHNEEVVGRAIRGHRDRVTLATKVGLAVDDLATRAMHRDGSPSHVRAAVDRSLRRLGVDTIDLYYLHRVDPAVPLLDTWSAMADLVAAGKVRWLGLSEVTVGEAESAHAQFPVTAVQSELSVWTRDPLGGPGRDAADLVAWCAANRVTFVPFAPLGRGFLTGRITGADFEPSDFRRTNPRFAPEARAANQRIVDVVTDVAHRHGATSAQVAIAWTLAIGGHVVPIPGTKRADYLAENVAAAELRLTPDDLAALDSVPAATGTRY
jgi:aryl-alcohol dehydrogenase-like predicted oxidoreductase